MTDRILITGAYGQLGFELAHKDFGEAELVTTDIVDTGDLPGYRSCDLSDEQQVRRLLDETQPTVVFNPAAYTAVDKAEEDERLCYTLNRDLPTWLATWCADNGAPLIHFSTDYVYPGVGETVYVEGAETGPLNVYGASKLAGDEAVLDSGATAFIFRTSWVYSYRGKNFVLTMLNLGADREVLSIVDDQVGAPTSALMLADASFHAYRVAQEKGAAWAREKSGVYHLVNGDFTSWKGFAEAIFEGARERGKVLKITEVNGTPTAEYPTPATRPLNSRLNTSKFQQTFDYRIPGWKQSLAEVLDRLLQG